MFEKVLVANRGEIAIRVMRTLEELGIGSVAVYSEPIATRRTSGAPTRRTCSARPAARATCRGEDHRGRKESGAEAVHPGYGFLAENAAFARACDKAGIKFIGPPADAIDAMGSKTRARELMKKAGVPIVPGTTDPVDTVDDARKIIDDSIGYPFAIKAAGGWRRQGLPRSRSRSPSSRRRSRARLARVRSSSPTRRSTSSATCPTRATWRCRSLPTTTATSCTSVSATARFSAVTRS
jgi:acetyl-CoA/propionyl-CoA carboxylase biotin carboxyl carrier protein